MKDDDAAAFLDSCAVVWVIPLGELDAVITGVPGLIDVDKANTAVGC